MIRKLSVLFLAVALISTAFAQERGVGNEKRIVPDVNYVAPQSPTSTLESITAIGETFITTDYDYGGNNAIPKMVSMADIDGTGDLDPFFVGMVRDNVAAVARYIAFGYSAFGAPIDAFRAFAPAQSLGWGTTQLCVGGPLNGNALVMAHSGGASWHSVIDLVNLAPVQPFPQTTFGSNFPDFVYLPDGTIWTTNTDGIIRKSTDVGATFVDVAPIGTGDPNVVLLTANGPSENPLYGNSTGQYMATVGGWGLLDTVAQDDGLYWYGTNDFGASWNGLVIGRDGYFGTVANNPNLAPFFENFGQLNANIDEAGTTHIVINGYGAGISGVDTVEAYPILYWNSNAAEWLEISLPSIAFEDGAILADLRPGNGIGQSYPSVSVTDDGQFIFVIWTAPEYTGAVGASPINIYDGTADNFYTDLHWTTSTDGGQTWAAPQVIGEPNVSETYASVARRLEILPNNDVKAHFVFFVDAIPGTSLFAGGNENALGTWQYLSAVVGNYTPSTDIPVTFQVDMGVQAFEGNFPAGATVVVRGSFQSEAGDPGGDWQGNLYQLSDGDGDTVYTGTWNIPASFAGTAFAYKYVIVNPPAGDNWESTPDRPFTLTAPATVNPVVWFNDDNVYTVLNEVTNTLNFTADISGILGVGVGGAFDPNQDSLLVMGLDWDNLGKDVVGNRRMFNNDPFNPGIYDASLTFTSGSAAANGVGDSTKWKFKAYPDGRFANTGWETGSDRWHIYQADGSVIDLPVLVPRIFPLFGPIANDVSVTFTVDLTGAVNQYNGLPIPLNELEFVGMRGGADFLGSWATGGNWQVSDTTTGNMKVLTNIGGNLWRRTAVVPAGTNAGVYEYKFAAVYPGADTVNGGSSPLDNEGGFGQNHSFTLADNPAGITIWNIFGDFTTTDVKEIEDLVPVAFELGQNYPNPFNPSTTIKFSVPEAGLVTLRVFNLLGQEVATLLNTEKTAGVYEATFDASSLSSGIYFYTLEAKNFTSTKKMVLLK
ncbi:MAG: T9SS type A sorting domain-containing protein [Ignavibacterium sp.]|nr:T9SS type A sorting domain-containing protein [Ignavibacterium sp.]